MGPESGRPRVPVGPGLGRPGSRWVPSGGGTAPGGSPVGDARHPGKEAPDPVGPSVERRSELWMGGRPVILSARRQGEAPRLSCVPS